MDIPNQTDEGSPRESQGEYQQALSYPLAVSPAAKCASACEIRQVYKLHTYSKKIEICV